MLKNELKAALAILGTVFVPVFAHADQSMNASGQQMQQPGYVSGEKIKAGQLPGAYNQSASYVCDNGWDVFVTADYIWWNWQQDLLQVGTLVTQSSGLVDGFAGDSTAVFTTPGYASGFQVGLGFNMKGMDDWNLYSEYTWYRNTENNSTTGTSTKSLVLPAAAFRGDQYVASAADIVGTVNTQAHMGFQALDFLLQRPFYFGKKLTSNFGAGLRAQWITQTFTASGSNLSVATESLTVPGGSSSAEQTTWQLGPKFAFESNWLLGYGFKIMANIAQSVLYTSYNTHNTASGTVVTTTFTGTQHGLHNYGTLRPVTETFLGLGWGMYFCDNNFHLDMSLGYDFNVHWDYNMMMATTGQALGNMYLHGLNVQVRFDF